MSNDIAFNVENDCSPETDHVYPAFRFIRADQYSLFANEVTDEEAPGYFDIVKKPMDFGTIKRKLDNGEYGSGSTAAALLYNDFMLVMDNCALYNDGNKEVIDEAARLLGLLPCAYASSCSSVAAKSKRKAPSKGRK